MKERNEATRTRDKYIQPDGGTSHLQMPSFAEEKSILERKTTGTL
jgi:hypothetical protein